MNLNDLIKGSQHGYNELYDYDGGTDVIYIGLATPSKGTDVRAWRIVKVTYDGNSNVTSILHANGSNEFDKIWDDRATYTYTATGL